MTKNQLGELILAGFLRFTRLCMLIIFHINF